MQPETEADLAAMIRAAKAPLRITGGGTRALPDEVGEPLHMAGLSGIALYEPEALTLVARAGTPLAEIEAALASEGQMLAFEPDPRPGSTIGGVAATNASGPRRLSAGACRDAMLGVRFVTGDGEIVKNGGRVMKNVTGYDLVKLMAGSRGQLGAITEVALKTAPIPPVRATLRLRARDDTSAIAVMVTAMSGPFDVTGAGRLPDGNVILRLEGLPGSVEIRAGMLRDAVAKHGDADILEGDADFAMLRDFAAGATGPLWRMVLRPSDAAQMLAGLPGRHAVDWGGALIWAEAPPDWMPDLPPGARATRLRGDAASLPETDPVTARLNAGLKQKFDPRGIFGGAP
ncbi:FAD-binding protein [Paracoccus aurantiacus]|uniref:FAD-binding protein n=1 Tax=Paracoccus aurantiacus TaxID=2599412 RepID=A0A5C6S7X4_9RHOB|nr:FAD-binding protein [Paracoccus aurantiacus]TXB70490.1 FAD-binding protein [Paracoccus aurantiacus]